VTFGSLVHRTAAISVATNQFFITVPLACTFLARNPAAMWPFRHCKPAGRWTAHTKVQLRERNSITLSWFILILRTAFCCDIKTCSVRSLLAFYRSRLIPFRSYLGSWIIYSNDAGGIAIFYQILRCHMPEVNNLRRCRREKLNPHPNYDIFFSQREFYVFVTKLYQITLMREISPVSCDCHEKWNKSTVWTDSRLLSVTTF
jgi:hypothetical protein